jgi:hypothetical protein
MYRVFCTIAVVLGVAACLGLQTANASLVDSSTFTYKWEMTDAAHTPDGTMTDGVHSDYEWWTPAGSYSAFTGTFNTADGTVTLPSGQAQWTTDFGNEIWPTHVSFATGWTLEARLKVVSDSSGPGFDIMGGTVDGGLNHDGWLELGASSTVWGAGSGAITLDSNDNAADFHTFRVAQAANSATYSVWRDGILLSDTLPQTNDAWGLTTALVMATGGTHGPSIVDYIRLEPSGPAVPEPGTITLVISGAIGLLAYAWRRRK